jgi:hypothetical protein
MAGRQALVSKAALALLSFAGSNASTKTAGVWTISNPSRAHRWPSRPDLGERWFSRLVATAEEDRLSFRRNPHTSFAAASDCRTIAIYEYAP